MGRDVCPQNCGRYNESILSPCLMGSGPENAKILIVGRDPGQYEDKKGVPFIGRSGKLLDDALAEVGIQRADCYVTHAVKCASAGEDKPPPIPVLKKCRAHLIEEINRVKPKLIATFGSEALLTVLGKKGINKFRNQVYRSDEFDAKVVAVYNPAYILRNPGMLADFRRGFEILAEEAGCEKIIERKKTKETILVANTVEKAKKVLAELRKHDVVAFDFETSSLDHMTADTLCISLSWKWGLGVCIPWDLFDNEMQLELADMFRSGKLKIGHNIKFDIEMLMTNKIKIKGPFFDCMTAHHLLDENSTHGLDDLTLRYLDKGEYWAELDAWKEKYAKENGVKKDEISYAHCPKEILYPYAAHDADATFRLYKLFEPKLRQEELWDFYNKYVLTTTEVIIQLERYGTKIDREKLKTIIDKYVVICSDLEKNVLQDDMFVKFKNNRAASLVKEVRAKHHKSKMLKSRYPDVEDYVKVCLERKTNKAKTTVNLKSTKQLAEIFFTKKYYGLKPIKYTDKKGISTDESVLQELADVHKVPGAKLLMEYRSAAKYLSTYLISTYKKSAADGRIHANFLQHRTVTGRLSSKKPNLQNIPRDGDEYKECFIADPGFIFVKGDLAQAEFRCWAHYAEDEDMIADIESGMDIHRNMAAESLGISESEVTKDQRTAAKSVVFGLMFGRGVRAIAEQYNIPEEQAQHIRDYFFTKYPKAARWLKDQKGFVHKYKHVRSWLGRIRRLPEIDSENTGLVAEAERQALNSPIQALSADMNNYFMYLTLKEARKQGIRCFPANTVHDANYFQCENGKVNELVCIMNSVVDTAFPDFRCKMKLDFEVGKDWHNLEGIKA